jgi:hypothetical protein
MFNPLLMLELEANGDPGLAEGFQAQLGTETLGLGSPSYEDAAVERGRR